MAEDDRTDAQGPASGHSQGRRICYGFRARKAKAARKKPLSAVKLVDDLAGESPVSASFPVGTVVISGDGAGNQTVESPEVNVLVGWMRIRSAPTRRANEATGRSVSEP